MGQENMDNNTGLKCEKAEILVVAAYCRLKRVQVRTQTICVNLVSRDVTIKISLWVIPRKIQYYMYNS